MALNYSPSKNVERRARQTALQVTPFLDKRRDASGFGRAPWALKLGSSPLKPSGDPAAWVTRAAGAELAAAGFETPPSADWKAGGALQETACSSGKRTICSVRLEAWLVGKDGKQALRQDYKGEGLRPPLFGEDPYELSLEEALREALAGFRKDVERLLP